ncbi:hypothetical protein DL769_000834 [Monosporascus sp. CRB-8-3]|nr:hypothetical protein DL769_000834 [Monosporascus sp. CRB-8-3]
MRLTISTLPAIALLPKLAIAQDDQWGVWFFSDGCHDTNDYSGIPGDENKVLTCMLARTDDPDGNEVPGPYTNIVSSNCESLGMKATLWNDTECRGLITPIDTDGCQVVPANPEDGGHDIFSISSVHVGCPDTTSPASESGPVDGWAWNIRVRADIPISETNVTNYDQDTLSKYFTGSQINLGSPSSEGIDPSWLVCVIRWQVDEDYSEELRQNDGTYSSVLGDSCRSDMADVVARTWADHSGTDRCRCPDLSNISSCGEPPAAFHQGCGATTYNATDINNSTRTSPGSWSVGEYLAITYGGAASARGDTTLYDQTGSLAWPFMVVWGPKSLHSVPTSQLTCVRVANATDGSQAPGTDGTSGDGGSGGSLSDKKSPIVILFSIFAAIWMTLV